MLPRIIIILLFNIFSPRVNDHATQIVHLLLGINSNDSQAITDFRSMVCLLIERRFNDISLANNHRLLVLHLHWGHDLATSESRRYWLSDFIIL